MANAEQRDFKDWIEILPQISSNTIPPMTHPLSKAWNQPDTKFIEITDEYAIMSQKTFNALMNYSHSQPSGVYEGKMWKSEVRYSKQNFALRQTFYDKWYLKWYGFSADPDCCSNNKREIIIK